MSNAKTGFVNLDGSPTEDGHKLIEWIESHFVEADKGNDVTAINALSGDIKHYYVNVYKLNRMTGGDSGGLTPERWLSDYRNSIAMNAWRNYQFTLQQEAKQSELEATTARSKETAAGLDALKESLMAEITKLQDASAALQRRLDADKKGKRVKQDETEDADAESEA